MIAPKHVSHVQPTGYDFSDRTNPDIITGIPHPNQEPRRAAARAFIESLGLGTQEVTELHVRAEPDGMVVSATVLRWTVDPDVPRTEVVHLRLPW